MLVRCYHHYHYLYHRAERSVISTLQLKLNPLCHRGSASSTCPGCPSYVLAGHHDCNASLSPREVSQPQGESYMVLGLSVAYLSHAHSCLPSHRPPKSVRFDSFSSAMHFVFLHRGTHLNLVHGILQVNSVIVSLGNVVMPADYSCM